MEPTHCPFPPNRTRPNILNLTLNSKPRARDELSLPQASLTSLGRAPKQRRRQPSEMSDNGTRAPGLDPSKRLHSRCRRAPRERRFGEETPSKPKVGRSCTQPDLDVDAALRAPRRRALSPVGLESWLNRQRTSRPSNG